MSDVLHPIRLLVLDRGFVKICRCPDPEGFAFWLPYTRGRTVRRWGTKNGLAELIDGPTTQTVLDAVTPIGKLPVRAILDVMEVDQKSWAKHLKT